MKRFTCFNNKLTMIPKNITIRLTINYIIIIQSFKNSLTLTSCCCCCFFSRSFSDIAAELVIPEKPLNHPEDQGLTFQETAIVPHGDAGTFAAPIQVSLVVE